MTPAHGRQAQRRVTLESLLAAYDQVRRREDLTPQAKHAWQLIYLETDGGRWQWTTTTKAVGEWEGRTNDAGRRSLEALAAAKLIRVQMLDPPLAKDTGRRLVSLLVDREEDELRPAPTEPQQELPLEVESTCQTSPTDGSVSLAATIPFSGVAGMVAAATPPPRPPFNLNLIERAHPTSDFSAALSTSKPPSILEERSGKPGGRGGAAAAATCPPASTDRPTDFAGIVAALPVADMAARQREAARLTDEIVRRVNCPSLFRCVAVRAAWAVVDGRLGNAAQSPDAVLYGLLDQLDEADRDGLIEKTRSAYFVGGLKILFADAHIPWNRSKVKPR